MITTSDSYNTVELGKHYIILPSSNEIGWTKEQFIKQTKAKRVKEGFSYNSRNNDKWLSILQLRKLMEQYFGDVKKIQIVPNL